MKEYWVYILRTDQDTLYTGQTADLQKRLERHRSGKGAKYMRRFADFRLVYVEKMTDLSAALRREAEIKRMSKKDKEEMIGLAINNLSDLSEYSSRRGKLSSR